MNLLGPHYLNQDATPKQRLVISIIMIIVMVGTLALLGNMTYQDDLDAQKRYCDGVASKEFPDYNGNAEQICANPSK